MNFSVMALIAVSMIASTIAPAAVADPIPDAIRKEMLNHVVTEPRLLRYGGGSLDVCLDAKAKIVEYDYDPELSGYIEICIADIGSYYLGPYPKAACKEYRLASEHFAAGVRFGNARLLRELDQLKEIIGKHCR